MKFKKKPVVIEAFQWLGKYSPWERWLYDYRGPNGEIAQSDEYGTIKIPTLDGPMTAQPGDWIIRGVKGEVYPCKDSIFQLTYEKISDETPTADARPPANEDARFQTPTA